MIPGVDPYLDAALGEEVDDGLADLAAGADVEHLLDVGDVDDLIKDGRRGHGVAGPDANVLVLEVIVLLDQTRNLRSPLVELLHLVQVAKAKVSGSPFLVLPLNHLDNVRVDLGVATPLDVVHRSPKDADDTSHVLFVDNVAGYFVRLHNKSREEAHQVHQEEFHRQRQPGADVLVVHIVDGEFGAGQDMSKTTVVADEDNVLLIGGEQTGLLGSRDLVLAVRSQHVIPDGHEQTIVGLVVLVMAEVELGSVEGIPQRGPLGGEDPSLQADVGVAEGIDQIEQDEVGADDGPVIPPSQNEGREEGWTEYGNVDEMLLEVLHEAGRGQSLDGGVVEAVHHLEDVGDVQPAVGEVVQRLDDGHVRQEGVVRARGEVTVGRKEHGGEDELQDDLGPHVQERADEVVLLLPLELTVLQLHAVIVLIEEEVMQRHEQADGNDAGDAGDVDGPHVGHVGDEERGQKYGQIDPTTALDGVRVEDGLLARLGLGSGGGSSVLLLHFNSSLGGCGERDRSIRLLGAGASYLAH
mmetsp:Transcript_2096/g.6038  ORF Transcript_2096/g.6038 Transcript_2096/m.6038 type:complete len:524 (-) Transcript_2096:373-1944(-)